LPNPGASCPVKEPGPALCMMASSRLSLLQLHRLDVSLVVSSDDPDDALQATQICHQLAGRRDRFCTEAWLAIAFPPAPRTESHPPQGSQASVATETMTGLAPGSPAVAPPATAAGPGKDEAARAPHCADRVPNWRIDRAEKIREPDGLKLRGDISTTPTTPEPIGSILACRFYCVLRSSDGTSPAMYTLFPRTALGAGGYEGQAEGPRDIPGPTVFRPLSEREGQWSCGGPPSGTVPGPTAFGPLSEREGQWSCGGPARGTLTSEHHGGVGSECCAD
jgi:hypothetical protein